MVTAYLGSYFNAVNELKSYSSNSYWTTTKAMIKFASYLTLFAPLAIGALYGFSALAGRLVYGSDSSTAKKTANVAAKILQSQQTDGTEKQNQQESLSGSASNLPLSDTDVSQEEINLDLQKSEIDHNHPAAKRRQGRSDLRPLIKILTGPLGGIKGQHEG